MKKKNEKWWKKEKIALKVDALMFCFKNLPKSKRKRGEKQRERERKGKGQNENMNVCLCVHVWVYSVLR